MTKHVFILTALFVVGSLVPVQAQGFLKSLEGNFGIKLGPAISRTQVGGSTDIIHKQNLDFLGLAGLTYRVRYQKFTLQPEILYTVKGGTFQRLKPGTATSPEDRTTEVNSFQYLSVPVMFGYIPTEGLTLQLGPEVSYLLNPGTANAPGTKTDFGVAVGAHYDFLDALEKFSLHVRYIYGLTNVSGSSTYSYYNRVLQVGIVYNFRKEK
jgi:Outer membrane protein beta-barrel domain